MNHNLFKDVLQQINNPKIKEFTIACLKDVPDIFNTMPASTSGKYHPIEASNVGGLVWHVNRACYFAFMYFQAYKWEGKDIRGDIVLSALLLHDIGKKEKYGKKYWEYINHPLTATTMIKKHRKIIPEKVYKLIEGCVLHHMGPWSPTSTKKDMTKYNFLELITYHSDYMSSRKEIKVK